jgi:60 kDa SS-A/Ro ribonucleoprotein
MARTNIIPVKPAIFTHEGGRANRTSVVNQLRRSVMACLLWENSFYESGADIAKRISDLVAVNKPEDVAAIAVEARTAMKLRHVPLLLARELTRLPSHRHVVGKLLPEIIQRPDEIGEFLSLYWKDQPNAPLANQVKKGLAASFNKFDEYSLAKWNTGGIRLRNAMFMVHPKPLIGGDYKDHPDDHGADAISKKGYKRGSVVRHVDHVFNRIASDTLKTPDTWEVELSGGADKKATFTRLINDNKLGAMALLRNLRGMTDAGVEREVIRKGFANMKADRVLPFRFISAAKHAPQFEPELETAMFRCLDGSEKLPGRTILVIDVSGSMTSPISGKGELSRIDAANGLAILLREVCQDIDVYTFATDIKPVPPRRGFALRDAVMGQFGGSTKLGHCLNKIGYGAGAARLIVLTDGQTEDAVKQPQADRNYMLNVAAYQNGVGYGAWKTIDGWSESVVQYIQDSERSGD